MLRSAGFAIVEPSRGGGLRLPPGRARRRAPARSIRRRGPGRARPDDRSGDDLERAQQQVALGLRARPRVGPCSRRWRGSPAQAIARREPGPAAGARRHVADRPRLHPPAGRRKGVLDEIDVVAVHGFPLDWNLWQIDEWPAKVAEIARGHRPAGLGVRGRRLDLRRGGGAGLGAAAHRRAAGRPGAAHPLVQPLRPAAGLGGDDAPPRGRGLVLLPPLPHGPAARGRHAQAAAGGLRATTRRAWASASGSTSRTTGSTTRCAWMQRLGVAAPAHRALLGRLRSAPDALDWFDRQMAALEDFDVTVTFCFTPEHRGHRAAPHQPAAGRGGVRRILRGDDAPLCPRAVGKRAKPRRGGAGLKRRRPRAG